MANGTKCELRDWAGPLYQALFLQVPPGGGLPKSSRLSSRPLEVLRIPAGWQAELPPICSRELLHAFLDGARQRRLLDVQPLGGAGEMEFIGDSEETP